MDPDHIGARILIVDDDEHIAKGLDYALTQQGYETNVQYTGKATIVAAAEWGPDLLILDLKLPDIDGLEVLAELRSRESTANTPVILLTAARTDPASRVEGLQLGANDYVIKPYSLSELLARVAANLRMARLTQRLEEMTHRLADVASRDALTGLYHHGKIMEKLSMEIYRAARYGVALSCIMIDLDKFKAINDTFGHQIGDEVLIRISNILKDNCRKTDIVGRYGGEEFLLILPHTSQQSACAKAEVLKERIAEEHFVSLPHGSKITASFGVASLGESDDDDATALVKRADDAMYAAKAAGGFRVVCLTP